jgi:hypothetical protein
MFSWQMNTLKSYWVVSHVSVELKAGILEITIILMLGDGEGVQNVGLSSSQTQLISSRFERIKTLLCGILGFKKLCF